MADFPESFPHGPEQNGFEPTATFDRETLLQLLATTGLSELTTGDGPSIVHVDSTPKDRGELYLNPDGKPVKGFMTKFADDFPGWQQGELVRARYVVSARDDQVSLLVADSYVGDVRNADRFVLEGDPTELDKLRQLGITELDLDLEVTSQSSKYIISNMFEYSARVDRVNHVLAPWDGESALEPGQVMLQGRVTEYVPCDTFDNDSREPGHVTLDVNGKPVTVDMNSGYLRYEGSPYEHLLREAPEPGDVVQLLTTYDPDFRENQRPYGNQRTSTFAADFCRSAYCLEPSATRTAEQEMFAAAVEVAIDDLAATTVPADFRRKYGELMDMALVKTGTFVKNCLTKTQSERIDYYVGELFTEEEFMQKPLLAVGNDFPSVYDAFKKEFGIDYSMSVAGAFATVMEIARDPSKLDPRADKIDYLCRVFHDVLEPEQMSLLTRTIVETYYPRTARKSVSFKKDEELAPGEVHYNQTSITETALAYMSTTGRVEDVEYLMKLFEDSVANDLFVHKRHEKDYLVKIIDSLNHTLAEAAPWSPDTGEHTIKDRAMIGYFAHTILPRLVDISRVYTDKVHNIGEIDGERHAEKIYSFTFDRIEKTLRLSDQLTQLL